MVHQPVSRRCRVSDSGRAGRGRTMRVVVVGATGNVGTSVLRSLENEERVESVLGLARRLPGLRIDKVEWAAADIARDDLVPHFRGADASWPTGGVPNSYSARQKAEVERRLDRFESQNPEVRVVRMRQGLTFKKEASQGIRRLFGGPFLPGSLARPEFINVLPEVKGLRGQVVHSYDVGEAYRLA